MVIPSKRYDFPETTGLDEVLEDIIEALKDLDKNNFRQYPNLEGVNLSSGENTVTNITIGDYTLGEGEFENLDGLDQDVATTSDVIFNTVTTTAGGIIGTSLTVGTTLTVTGAIDGNGYSYSIVAKTAAYTMTANDDTVTCGAGNQTFTIDLPTPVAGKRYSIKNAGSGVITVDADTTGSTTIDGDTTQPVNQYECLEVISDGTVYWAI